MWRERERASKQLFVTLFIFQFLLFFVLFLRIKKKKKELLSLFERPTILQPIRLFAIAIQKFIQYD